MEEDKITSEKMEVCFKANSEIPYINIRYGFKIFEVIRKTKKSKTSTVDVVLNGDYRGIYILIEAVKDSEARINIDETGYIFEYFTTTLLKEWESHISIL